MTNKLKQSKLIGMDRQRKIKALNNIKELTKLLCERCCWDVSNGYMINYNGYVLESVGGYFDSGFLMDIYGIIDDFSRSEDIKEIQYQCFVV